MDERLNQLMNFILNDPNHLKRFNEQNSVFKLQKKSLLKAEITANAKPILKGQLFAYSRLLKQFKLFYFELYPNILVKYQDKTKAPPVEQVHLQNCLIGDETETFGEQAAYGITLASEDEIAKLVTDKHNIHITWLKCLRGYCRSTNFNSRYKLDSRMYDHFYRCIDKKKRAYTAVKIVNKKGLRAEQKQFLSQEIAIFRRVQAPQLPKLKKIYEDENYIYLNFEMFQGEDLLKVVHGSVLEEIAIATLTHHVLKGLKCLHSQGVYHGNLKLDNIVFGSTINRPENEIFLINLKYSEEITEFYRERLIKKGTNQYIAPEILEGSRIGPEIDMFALGVCMHFMAFKTFPYTKIEKIPHNSSSQSQIGGNQVRYRYELDLKQLESLQKEKKLNPNKKQANTSLSASGIDFLMRLLDTNPDTRLKASQALTHHWFINFTSKPAGDKKLAEYRQSKRMQSLLTILECSEISERELEQMRKSKLRGLTFQSMHTMQSGRSQTILNESLNRSINYTINGGGGGNGGALNQSLNQQNSNEVSTVYTLSGDHVSEEDCALINFMHLLDVQQQRPRLISQLDKQFSTTTLFDQQNETTPSNMSPLSLNRIKANLSPQADITMALSAELANKQHIIFPQHTSCELLTE